MPEETLKWLNPAPKQESNNFKTRLSDCREICRIKIDILNDKLVIRKMSGLKYMEIKNKLSIS